MRPAIEQSRTTRRITRRAFTLVELLMALVILTILSLAVSTLLGSAGRTNQYVNSQSDATMQVEMAYRRIMHNLRTASALATPSSLSPGNSLTVSTQADPSYGNTPATVSYSLSGGALIETDSRYGTATLVTGISTFSVTRVSMSYPTQITLTITSNSIPPVTRSATITCRNF